MAISPSGWYKLRRLPRCSAFNWVEGSSQILLVQTRKILTTILLTYLLQDNAGVSTRDSVKKQTKVGVADGGDGAHREEEYWRGRRKFMSTSPVLLQSLQAASAAPAAAASGDDGMPETEWEQRGASLGGDHDGSGEWLNRGCNKSNRSSGRRLGRQVNVMGRVGWGSFNKWGDYSNAEKQRTSGI